MRRSVLIVMIDVLVLSALSLTLGGGDSRFVIPVNRWSDLIERGLEKEQEYEARMAALRNQAEQQAQALAEAEALKAALQREKAGLAAEADTAQARAAASEAEAAAALKQARRAQEAERTAQVLAEAEARARAEAEALAQAERDRALKAVAEAQTAQMLKEQAEAATQQAAAQQEAEAVRAAQAITQAAQAELEARLAREREADARARAVELQATAESGSDRLLEVTASLKVAEKNLQSLARQAETARQREEAAQRTAAEALRKEQDAAAAMQRLEQDRRLALDRLKQMDSRLAGAQRAEEQAMQALNEMQQKAETAAARLAQIEADKKQSVWVVREKAVRRFHATAGAESTHPFPNRTSAVLHLPLTELDGQLFAITTFSSLQLDWWGIQRENALLTYTLSMDHVRAGTLPDIINASLIQSRVEPRAVYIQVPRSEGDSGLRPIGLNRIKEERIQTGLLFKKEEPDSSLTVEFMPSLDANGYLLVRTAEPASKVKIREGDYLLTRNGFLIGLMVTRDLCYVVPEQLPPPEQRHLIPVIKSSEDRYLKGLTQTARTGEELIKELPDSLKPGRSFFWPSF